MKVSELIEELEKYDGEKEVCIVDYERNVYEFTGICNKDYMIDEFGVCLQYE